MQSRITLSGGKSEILQRIEALEQAVSELKREIQKKATDKNNEFGLTRAKINQLPLVSTDNMSRGEGIGYVINVRKDSYKTAIVKCDGDLYAPECGWVISSPCTWRIQRGRRVFERTFKSEGDGLYAMERFLAIIEQADACGQIFV